MDHLQMEMEKFSNARSSRWDTEMCLWLALQWQNGERIKMSLQLHVFGGRACFSLYSALNQYALIALTQNWKQKSLLEALIDHLRETMPMGVGGQSPGSCTNWLKTGWNFEHRYWWNQRQEQQFAPPVVHMWKIGKLEEGKWSKKPLFNLLGWFFDKLELKGGKGKIFEVYWPSLKVTLQESKAISNQENISVKYHEYPWL